MKGANVLYYGDNLDVLRRHIGDETVDLVYLDPPFKSDQDYNVLFANKHGSKSAAQINAFEDTWHWDQSAEAAYTEVVEGGGKVADAMRAFRTFLGENDMMAYLAMMAPRLIELRRVLKPTGSIYLHCDPTASHYLKMLLDAVFGPTNFRNEIVWRRTPFSGSSKARARQLPRSHDVILFYSRGEEWTWHAPTEPYTEEYLERFKWQDARGKYRKTLLKTYSAATLKRLRDEDRLIEPVRPGAHYSYKQYLHESKGFRQIDDVWTDINAINPVAKERLGYPTQKPEDLLDRIILASSNEGDMVLDPFCGCGTTISAAERLKRHWIGIDITHLAISLMKHRLRDAFGGHATFEVKGEPVDLDGAEALAKEDAYQFQFWALGLVGARPTEEKKGADRGIDGRLYFHDEGPGGPTKQVIFSVKSGKLKAGDVRDLRGVIDREKAEFGVLISLDEPTKEMRKEAASTGMYKWAFNGENFPRLQLLTIEDIMGGAGLAIPGIHGNVTFKRAPAAREHDADHGDLFTGTSKLKPKKKQRRV